jgi:hypothetical protein
MEMWNIENIEDDFKKIIGNLGIAKLLIVAAGVDKEDNSHDEFSVAGVLILNESINASDAETEFMKNLDDDYVRVYDRTIDGHKGVYIQSGDDPDDDDMEHIGYWLDKSEEGMASEVGFVINKGPESAMTTLLNTVRIEKLAEA